MFAYAWEIRIPLAPQNSIREISRMLFVFNISPVPNPR